MKKAFALLAGLVLLLVAAPGLADGHGHGRHYGHGYGWGHGRAAYRHWHGGHVRWHGPRVVIGVGPGFWPGWWYGPPPPYESRTVIVERPVYVERPTQTPAPTPSSGYWYYCQSARGYYPNVPSCPEPWVPVPPQPQ